MATRQALYSVWAQRQVLPEATSQLGTWIVLQICSLKLITFLLICVWGHVYVCECELVAVGMWGSQGNVCSQLFHHVGPGD